MATSLPLRCESGTNTDNQTSSEEASTKHADGASKSVNRPAILKRICAKLGLNVGIVLLMIKGACPPIIATALYQNDGFASTYSTLGYLVAIISILSFAILPRSKFIQTMTFNIIGVCFGAAVALLEVYCSVSARQNTSPVSTSSSGAPLPGANVSQYNSSASAVSAIWLFVNIFFSNSLRFSRPQLTSPVIIYSIFANVASTYAPQFATMTQGKAFVARLLEAFLTGFGIAIGVNLVVFPMNTRQLVFGEAVGYVSALQGVLKAQSGYLHSLEQHDMFPSSAEKKGKDQAKADQPAKDLKAALAGLVALHGKLQGDLAFAKREIAFGKLDAKDLDKIFTHFRQILLPLLGMGSVVDIFERVADRHGWNAEDENAGEAEKLRKETEKLEWNEIIRSILNPFEELTSAMHDGLQHVLYTLELSKRPKESKSTVNDTEANAGIVHPGDPKFKEVIEAKVNLFYEQRRAALKTWAKTQGMDLSTFDPTVPVPGYLHKEDGKSRDHRRNQQQLFLILYMEFLLWSTGKAVLDLVKFADGKTEDGAMKEKRLILPGRRRTMKWIKGALSTEDDSAEHTPDQAEAGLSSVSLGESFHKRRDPEHLPPTNAWQRFGNGITKILEVLSSTEVSFGFRVACATMSIGIIAFLESTTTFFIEQRLVWAMIMVAIGMTLTAGSGAFGLAGRVAGTFVAMCTSLMIWYIAGGVGIVGAVIPLMFIFLMVEVYFLLKFPRFTVVILITMVTQVLIVDYELQVKKVGVAVASSNGQPFYPTYELAPYRLATVAGGCLVAFIWTFLPYPLTARSTLRQHLGKSLYLLANYYSCVHTTVGIRFQGNEGDLEDKNSPGRRLEKVRDKILTKELTILTELRQLLADTAFEPSIGGKYPRETYESIIREIQNILNYIALIAYSTGTFSTVTNSPTHNKWAKDFSKLVKTVTVTSHEIVMMLSLLSASVVNGSPLPPYLKAPYAYELTAKLEELDGDILSISHMAEPGYAAFAVTQVASSLIDDDLEKLIVNVKTLVGEVDFSFHIISTADSSAEDVRKSKRE